MGARWSQSAGGFRSGVVGLLLAGGQSRRAGVDKRYLVLQGRTLAQRNLAFLKRHFSRVVVSLAAGQTLDLGDAGQAEVVYDAWPGASPMVGIASALQVVRGPVFALAVDLAFPDDDALSRVVSAASGRDLAVPVVDHHFEPLFAVYGPSCLAPMTALLQKGKHRIIDVFGDVDTVEVPFGDASLFVDVNTLEAFATVRRWAAAAGLPPVGAAAADSRPYVDLLGDAGTCDGRRHARPPALVAVVAKSDTGKTTLIEKLLPELIRLGARVGTVKHDAHSFEIDHPGKDSWRHGQAGAHAYVVASREKLAYVARLDGEMPLSEIARRFFAGFDLVLAEGYKRSAPHCVEVFRLGSGHTEPLCAPGEAMALVTDAPIDHEHRFGLEDAAGLARFLVSRLESLRRY